MVSIFDYTHSNAIDKERYGGKQENIKRADNISDKDFKLALAGLTTSNTECAENVNHDIGTPCSSKKILKVLELFNTGLGRSSKKVTFEKEDKYFEKEDKYFEKEDKYFEKEDNSSEKEDNSFEQNKKKNLSFLKENILPTAETDESEIIRNAADILGCTSESCVISHPSLRKFIIDHKIISPKELDFELELRFKAPGPRNSLNLLSNFNIDETLQRWARTFPKFFPCPFAMMDFDHNGDFFGKTDLPAIMRGEVDVKLGPAIGKVRNKFECFGCIVNTDTSRGPGKHWVAVFVDCRSQKIEDSIGKPWTVEYFNSSGRPPPKSMINWMERIRAQLSEYRSKREECRNAVCDVITVSVTDMDHQQSETECGMYALFYIRRRLEGVPYSFFENQLIPDNAMTEFRQHVFRDT